MFSSSFMLFPKFKKKIGVKKMSGGGVLKFFFLLEKVFFLISRFMLFSTLKKLILKSAPSNFRGGVFHIKKKILSLTG